MRRDKDYGWLWPVLGCFLLTAFIVWLFARILASIEVKDKVLKDFLDHLRNFDSFESWFFMIAFAFIPGAMLTGFFIKFCHFCSERVKLNKIKKQKAFR